MNITVGTAILDFDEQAIDLVIGAAHDLRDIAQFLAIGADQIGIEQLCFAKPERGRDGNTMRISMTARSAVCPRAPSR